MSTVSYNYTQVDFTSATNVNNSELYKIVVNSSITSATIQCINGSYVSGADFSYDIVFDQALSEGDKTTLDGIVAAYVYHAQNDTSVILKEFASPGTNGGTFTAGSWVQRRLNAVIGDVAFLSLVDNQFTLDPGQYHITASAPACNVDHHQIRLYDVTNNLSYDGNGAYSTNGNPSRSTLMNLVILSTETTFEIQHICDTTVEGIGLGTAAGLAACEIYTTVTIVQS